MDNPEADGMANLKALLDLAPVDGRFEYHDVDLKRCDNHVAAIHSQKLQFVNVNEQLAQLNRRFPQDGMTLMGSLNQVFNLRKVKAVDAQDVTTYGELPPPGKFVTEDVFARKRWRRVQFLVEQFWSRWRKEYLLNLNARQKWHVPKRNLLPDDVVIISDDHAAHSEWQLARVIEAKEDADGLVRKVKLRVRTSFIERPVQKLVLLLESGG